jgi:hypothetical protein
LECGRLECLSAVTRAGRGCLDQPLRGPGPSGLSDQA